MKLSLVLREFFGNMLDYRRLSKVYIRLEILEREKNLEDNETARQEIADEMDILLEKKYKILERIRVRNVRCEHEQTV